MLRPGFLPLKRGRELLLSRGRACSRGVLYARGWIRSVAAPLIDVAGILTLSRAHVHSLWKGGVGL